MTDGMALEHFGPTQQQLLRHLLHAPGGLAVDGLVSALGISTNAVRQHLTALERDGLVRKGQQRPTTPRPQQLYELSAAGRELFPRRYSLLADQVLAHTREALGPQALQALMQRLGGAAGAEQRSGIAGGRTGRTAERLATAMAAAGYEAEAAGRGRAEEVVAYNCVFHHLAARFPEVCEYDLEFIRQATGGGVEHAECMVRGGKVCRFVLKRGD